MAITNNLDTRTRKNIFPVKIVKTFGNVQNQSQLFKDEYLQISPDEWDLTVLDNTDCDENAGIVLDFGVEIHGCPRILVYDIIGNDTKDIKKEIQISCGESVSEALSNSGEKGSGNYHSLRNIVFTPPYMSDITFNETGFRFIFIKLLSSNVKLLLKKIVAVSVYRDLPILGTFTCDRPLLNEIYKTAVYTISLVMQNLIVDGIKRDRMVWMGDMRSEILAIRTAFGKTEIVNESIRFLREHSPKPKWINDFPTYSLWYIISVYDWYLYTGDEEFLEENREFVTETLKQISTHIKDDGTDTLPRYFFDWPTHDTAEEIIGSRAIMSIALEAGEKLCRVIKNKSLANLCSEKRRLLGLNSNEIPSMKQVVAMASLAGWIGQEKACNKILYNGCEDWSVFMCYYLLKAASEFDMKNTLKCFEKYYGKMLEMGATTFWEEFDVKWAENACRIDEIPKENQIDIHGDNGKFCYKGFRNSLCHGWSATPIAFLAENVLGITILEPGCKKIQISPNIGDLKWVNGEFPTPHGILKVSHKRISDKKIETTYFAPEGVEVILS